MGEPNNVVESPEEWGAAMRQLAENIRHPGHGKAATTRSHIAAAIGAIVDGRSYDKGNVQVTSDGRSILAMVRGTTEKTVLDLLETHRTAVLASVKSKQPPGMKSHEIAIDFAPRPQPANV